MSVELPDLLPGDHLCYFNRWSLLDWVVAVKTWSPVSHIEIYAGDRMSFASRNGQGVGKYMLQKKGLVYVLRPRVPFDFEAGRKWFYTHAIGQDYDWLGLLCFTLAVKQGSPRKMFCSEFGKRFDMACKLASFHEDWNADKTAPGNFLMSPAFDHFWKSGRV